LTFFPSRKERGANLLTDDPKCTNSSSPAIDRGKVSDFFGFFHLAREQTVVKPRRIGSPDHSRQQKLEPGEKRVEPTGLVTHL